MNQLWGFHEPPTTTGKFCEGRRKTSGRNIASADQRAGIPTLALPVLGVPHLGKSLCLSEPVSSSVKWGRFSSSNTGPM